MGRHNQETGLVTLIVILVILCVSLSFSMGIVATMGKLSPLDTNKSGESSTDWQQNQNYSADSKNWSSHSSDDMDYSHDQTKSAGEMDREVNDMMNQSRDSDLFGKISSNGSHIRGGFISFDLNQSDGSLDNYVIEHNGQVGKVFDSVVCVGFVPSNITKVGSVMRESSSSTEIVVHNNPTAMMKCVLNGTNQMVHFMCNVSWTVYYDNRSGQHAGTVTMTKGNLTGMIMVDNGTLMIEKNGNRTMVMAMASRGQVAFITNNPDVANAADDDKIMRGIGSGKVAGRLSVVLKNGSAVTEEQEYMDATMKVMTSGSSRMEIEVDSASSTGKVVQFVVDKQSLNVTSAKIVALLNGAKMARMSLDQVLAMNGTGKGDAKFVVIDEGRNWNILAYIPHFSSQVVSLEVNSSPTSTANQNTGIAGSTILLTTSAIVAVVFIAIVIVLAALLLRKANNRGKG